ncbi:hypothetical protein GOP47_0025656 [Adiantum capillus-veneris]|uniref:Uncharacterized protein n=1 Tax=Adiantum capillus-veneris TaxID=13818 RepID=A0A9D4U1B7_ADICA|nr:hypothetical protein GOP47_0025656 [Adiantum capillus-veneris]
MTTMRFYYRQLSPGEQAIKYAMGSKIYTPPRAIPTCWKSQYTMQAQIQKKGWKRKSTFGNGIYIHTLHSQWDISVQLALPRQQRRGRVADAVGSYHTVPEPKV